jgi:hypothetical protein
VVCRLQACRVSSCVVTGVFLFPEATSASKNSPALIAKRFKSGSQVDYSLHHGAETSKSTLEQSHAQHISFRGHICARVAAAITIFMSFRLEDKLWLKINEVVTSALAVSTLPHTPRVKSHGQRDNHKKASRVNIPATLHKRIVKASAQFSKLKAHATLWLKRAQPLIRVCWFLLAGSL